MQHGRDCFRRWTWFAIVACAGWWATTAPNAFVHGQEPKQAEVAKEAEAAPPAVAPAPAAADEADAPKKENFLAYVFKASPVFFFIMFGISCYLVTLVFQGYSQFRLPNIIPAHMVGNLDVMLGEKKFKEAYEVVRSDQSLFARALTAGVERLSHGFDRGMDAMVTVAEDGKMEMEHKVSPVATIGSVAPMIGLLGTVIGMIGAFGTISGGGQIQPDVLARDIGLALVTTLEGIIVAVPAIYFFAVMRNKISRLVFEVETVGETYLWRFAAALKK